MSDAIPATRDLTIYQGDTYTLVFRVRSQNADGTPGAYINLTGCTAKAQIRVAPTSTTTVADFAVTIANQSDSATVGQVTLALGASQTQAMTYDSAFWDVQISFPTGVVQTFLRGKVTLIYEITR